MASLYSVLVLIPEIGISTVAQGNTETILMAIVSTINFVMID